MAARIVICNFVSRSAFQSTVMNTHPSTLMYVTCILNVQFYSSGLCSDLISLWGNILSQAIIDAAALTCLFNLPLPSPSPLPCLPPLQLPPKPPPLLLLSYAATLPFTTTVSMSWDLSICIQHCMNLQVSVNISNFILFIRMDSKQRKEEETRKNQILYDIYLFLLFRKPSHPKILCFLLA